MELCVLIPEELNVSIDLSDNQTASYFVCSKVKIEKDREFFILDGDFRLGKIKKDEQLVDSLPTELKNIISFDFTINDRRHCNWIKFLNIKTKLNSQVNLVCNYNDNKFIFKTIKSIEPNTCLYVYFDLNNLNLSTIENQKINSSTFLDNNDLHKKLINASEYTLFNNDNYQEIIKTTNLKKRKLNTDDYLDDNQHQNGINKRKKTSKLVNNIDQYFSEQSDENDGFEDDDNLSIDSPINLVKRSESYENINSNDVITNSNEEESNDIDLIKNGTATINSSQSSSIANSCSNSNETIITKDKNNNLNNSNNNSNGSNQNSNGKRPHPFSYHRNKTCHIARSNMLPCEVCGKSFDRPSLLRRHLRTHTGEKPHVCDLCSKGFSTSSSLNTHRRIHTGEKPHVCPQCKKSFTASSNLYYHRMTHQRDKPHRCGLCDKSFPTPGDLKSHSYIHNGNWPFKCRQCGKGFSKANCLSTHEFLHTGEKPHVCEVCGKAFALESNLRAHYKTHQNNLLQVNSKKTVSINYKNSAINNNNQTTISSPSTILPSVSLSNLNSNIAALIQQQQPKTDQKSKLNNLLNTNNNNLLSTLTNLDSFKQLLNNQNTESNKESNKNGVNNMLINNYSNLFSSILNNNSTNLINQQQQTNQLMPSILQNLNSINNLNSLNQLPLTPIDSPTTCQSSPNIPWLNTSNKKQNQLNLDILKEKDSSNKNHLNTLMANNLIPQICQNNNDQQTDNLQQLILMATTAQLLSLKYK